MTAVRSTGGKLKTTSFLSLLVSLHNTLVVVHSLPSAFFVTNHHNALGCLATPLLIVFHTLLIVRLVSDHPFVDRGLQLSCHGGRPQGEQSPLLQPPKNTTRLFLLATESHPPHSLSVLFVAQLSRDPNMSHGICARVSPRAIFLS